MIPLLSVLSISSTVAQNTIYNHVCKKNLTTDRHVYKYNMYVYIMCAVLFGVFLFGENISLYTVGLGLVFGVVTALSNFYKMCALADGPMHITLLITTSSLIIPTMSGIFFGETFSFPKLCLAIVLIFFIYLSISNKGQGKVNKKWTICCTLAFLCQGAIGVLQKIHQTSVHKDELNGFLFVAFICSTIYCFIRSGRGGTQLKLDKKFYILALICGLCTYTMNFLNLRLSGIIPSQLFFPVINGSSIVLCSAISVIFFKEKLSKKQYLGLIGGILTLIGICIVK